MLHEQPMTLSAFFYTYRCHRSALYRCLRGPANILKGNTNLNIGYYRIHQSGMLLIRLECDASDMSCTNLS